ncbi:hypothetical protein CU664_06175 [Pseudomonas syringae pv. actinidifoliorum]|nr:hypothetical protein [Pseudomonas syringae pv. actinidifoliorum]NAT62911.1 hypothetical protein [Pseudomonas syringae pv. actinidifoliorum]
MLRVGTHFVTLRFTSKPSGKCRITHKSRLLPGGRRSKLARDLPGTGSKTYACGTSSANQVSRSGYSNLSKKYLLKQPRSPTTTSTNKI